MMMTRNGCCWNTVAVGILELPATGGAFPHQHMQHVVLEATQGGFRELARLPVRLQRHATSQVREKLRDGLVGDGVDAQFAQLLLQPRVPVILHVIVGATRQLGCYE